jgi:hypothetical protein
VVDVRVNPSVRDESEQVHAPPALEGGDEGGVLEERAVVDRPVHAHQVLVEDPPGADRQMPHLRIAHLTRRQTDGLARRVERRVRVGLPQAIEHRGSRQLDRIAGAGRRAAPAVEHDERY